MFRFFLIHFIQGNINFFSCIQHADILKRTYLCQVSDTGSPEPLVLYWEECIYNQLAYFFNVYSYMYSFVFCWFSFVFLLFRKYCIFQFDHLIPVFFSGMPYILFIGYMSTHLVLRILSNPNNIFAVKVSATFYENFMTYHCHFTAKKHRPSWFRAKSRCAYCIIYCTHTCDRVAMLQLVIFYQHIWCMFL
jgi:hypothetical protein